jgi:hypothetical protein
MSICKFLRYNKIMHLVHIINLFSKYSSQSCKNVHELIDVTMKPSENKKNVLTNNGF